jgi:hypothetical protein
MDLTEVGDDQQLKGAQKRRACYLINIHLLRSNRTMHICCLFMDGSS